MKKLLYLILSLFLLSSCNEENISNTSVAIEKFHPVDVMYFNRVEEDGVSATTHGKIEFWSKAIFITVSERVQYNIKDEEYLEDVEKYIFYTDKGKVILDVTEKQLTTSTATYYINSEIKNNW